MKSKITGLLLATVLVGATLRLYQLDKIPNSVSADEAAFGYNAFSLLKTGRDEFGHFLPLYFQSFDDNKNPVFGYLLIPFIYLFGLSDWAIRLPSSLAGIGVIFLSFLVTWELTRRPRLSLLVGLFISVSPWLIQYSRVAIEMELALLLSLVAVWLFLKARTYPLLYLSSALSLAGSFYTYHSSKVWTFLFGAVLVLLNFRRVRSRYLLVSILLFILLTIPYFLLFKTVKLGIRPFAVSVFSNQEDYHEAAKMALDDAQKNYWDGQIIHNRRLVFLNQAVNGYLSVLSPQLLFAQSPYNQIPQTRLFYLWQLPLIAVGLYFLVDRRKLAICIITWWLIGMTPGGLTIFPPFDRRILLSSFPLIFLTAYGIVSLLKILPRLPRFPLILTKLILVVIVASSVYFYVHHYYVHGPLTVVDTWGNGSKEVVEAVRRLKHNYETVYVSIKSNQPHTFFLYYLKYPPETFLREGGTVSGGYLDERNRFDSFRFKIIKPQDLASNSLYVWQVNEIQPCLEPLQTISMSDGEPLVHIGVFDASLAGCTQWLKNPPS